MTYLLLENAAAVVMPRMTRRGKLVQPFLCDREHYAVMESVPWSMSTGGYHQARVRPGSTAAASLPAGRWYAHCAVWYLAGCKTVDELAALGLSIDHADRWKHNNTLDNLRPATERLQSLNNGGRGYYWNSRDGNYQARAYDAAGRQFSLGYYATEREASAAYAPVRDAFVALEVFLSSEIYYGRLSPGNLQKERLRLAHYQGLPFCRKGGCLT